MNGTQHIKRAKVGRERERVLATERRRGKSLRLGRGRRGSAIHVNELAGSPASSSLLLSLERGGQRIVPSLGVLSSLSL